MRVFWALIGVLILSAAVVWGRPLLFKPATPAPAPLAVSPSNPTSNPTPNPAPAPAPAIAATPAAPEPTVEAKIETKVERKPTEVADTKAPEVKPEPKAEPTVEPTAEAAVPKPAATDTPAPTAKITKKDDGSIVIDDLYTVRGSGTAESPYELSWELLTSISDSYDPRVGKKKLPDRLTMFDGKVVRLTGYIAYPMFVEQPRELLSMLNQWDGCCIGVPPTPYDAIEVHLKETVTKDQRLATYGSVEGKFSVKPYLAGDWLVGLYILENAKVASTKATGQGS